MRAIYLSQLLLVTTLASACAAWNSLPERPSPAAKRRIQVELSKYEESLRLSVSPEHNQVAPGQRLLVMFTLRNDGPEGLKPCLAERGAIHFFGLDKRYVEAAELSIVDHPFCKISLPVASGESISWSREIIVPSIPSSTAKLMASIYLVYPNDCDRYGCDGISLSADASPITVTNNASSSNSEAVGTAAPNTCGRADGNRPIVRFRRSPPGVRRQGAICVTSSIVAQGLANAQLRKLRSRTAAPETSASKGAY